jgi:hypothetical protein
MNSYSFEDAEKKKFNLLNS